MADNEKVINITNHRENVNQNLNELSSHNLLEWLLIKRTKISINKDKYCFLKNQLLKQRMERLKLGCGFLEKDSGCHRGFCEPKSDAMP